MRRARLGYQISTTNQGGGPNPVTTALRKLGVHGKYSYEKSVPRQYMIASVMQRWNLLQGLMDTDGFVDERGIVGFCSTSRALADDIVELVRSLGGTAKRRQAEAWFGDRRHRDAHWVSLRLPSTLNPFRLSRKADRVNVQREPARILRTIEPSGDVECVCIRVASPDRLYITRDYIVTHNSFTAAAAVLWFLASWHGARVFTFAPGEKQLRAYMWMEIGKLWPRFKLQFPTALLTDLRIRMRGVRDGAWGAEGYAVGIRAGQEVSVNAQGMHAEHLLLVYEEMPGIPPAVTEAGENTATAPHNLRLGVGNPDHQLDALHLMGHDKFGKVLPGVTPIRISGLDHPNVVTDNPNVVPGAVSSKSIGKRLRKYTETGRLYRSRVRGISPAEAAEALIKLEWIQRAQTMWLNEDTKRLLTNNGKAKRALGVDVANSVDGDLGSISDWLGAYMETIEAFPCPNANLLGFDVHLRMQEKKIEDENVGVDVVGVGAGTVNELTRLDHVVIQLGSKKNADTGEIIQLAGEDVVIAEEFNHPRSRWYWRMARDLEDGLIALPPDPELAVDLITPTWTTRGGVIIVESKEKIIERLGRSPNKGDAAVYGNWVRDRSPMVSALPKRKKTIAERIQKELEDMDKHDQRRPTSPRRKYGSVLRQS